MRTILLAGTCCAVLSGCIPAAAGLALTAASLITGGGGGKGGDGFSNPIDRQTTGRDIRRALSQLDDQVDPACQAMLDEHRQSYGTVPADTAVQSKGPAAERAGAASPSSDERSSEDKARADRAAHAEPPVNLLAKIEPTLTPEAAPEPASETAPKSTAASAAPAPGSTEPAATATAQDTSPDTAQPVKASLGSEATPAPGRCEHRFVCLPGTPKPTLMLMCPGKGDTVDKDEKTMASASPESGQADGGAAPSGQAAVVAGSDTAAAPVREANTAAAAVPASPSPAADTAVSSDATAPRTIQSGGVADWNWSFDPSKRR